MLKYHRFINKIYILCYERKISMKIDNINNYLRDNDVKPSYQRTKIFEYILKSNSHPTVNEIYEALVDEIPTLSKTTVYNTLNLFVEKKIVEMITIEGNEARYDIFNPEAHAHFKCEVCRKVYDISLDISEAKAEALKGFDVKEQYIHFKGVCPHCKKLFNSQGN